MTKIVPHDRFGALSNLVAFVGLIIAVPVLGYLSGAFADIGQGIRWGVVTATIACLVYTSLDYTRTLKHIAFSDERIEIARLWRTDGFHWQEIVKVDYGGKDSETWVLFGKGERLISIPLIGFDSQQRVTLEATLAHHLSYLRTRSETWSSSVRFPVLVLRTGRIKFLLYSFICFLFMATGVWLLQRQAEIVAWLTIVVFGSCGFLLLASALWTPSLRLTNEGFSWRQPLGSRTYKWSEIESFKIGEYGTIQLPVLGFVLDLIGLFISGVGNPRGQKAVVFTLTAVAKASRRHPPGSRIDRSLSNNEYDDVLPYPYGLPLEHLLGLMNEWMARNK